MSKVLESVGVAGLVLGFILAAGVIGLLVAFPIMWTWNAVIPYLFGLPVLTWGKAWCLYFLCNCLVKASQSNTNK